MTIIIALAHTFAVKDYSYTAECVPKVGEMLTINKRSLDSEQAKALRDVLLRVVDIHWSIANNTVNHVTLFITRSEF